MIYVCISFVWYGIRNIRHRIWMIDNYLSFGVLSEIHFMIKFPISNLTNNVFLFSTTDNQESIYGPGAYIHINVNETWLTCESLTCSLRQSAAVRCVSSLQRRHGHKTGNKSRGMKTIATYRYLGYGFAHDFRAQIHRIKLSMKEIVVFTIRLLIIDRNPPHAML